MWTKARQIYIFLFINAAVCLVHVEAFQSTVPDLGILSISLHLLVLAYLAGFGRLALIIVANLCAVLAHIQVFQSPVPWLVWLTLAFHAFIMLFYFTKNKQSKK